MEREPDGIDILDARCEKLQAERDRLREAIIENNEEIADLRADLSEAVGLLRSVKPYLISGSWYDNVCALLARREVMP